MKKFLHSCPAFLLALLLVFSCAVPTRAAQTEAAAANKGFSVSDEALLSALYEADVSALREAVLLGLIRCEELSAYYLQRIEAFNDPYNCFITLCDDALETARQRDRQLAEGTAEGLLFGVPVIIKDNMDLIGYPTTNGYALSSAPIAGTNAAVVDSLLREGAVILGKSNMSAGAQDARRSYSYSVGETKNAYSTHMTSGGSSGGSAVSASLNFAAAALGTDTNSSLRFPAVLNGCVSLRPTFGLLPQDGLAILNPTRDTPGAITRTVYDQAVLLDALTGGVHQFTEHLNGSVLDGLRIGILTDLCQATEADEVRTEKNIDREVIAAFENAVAELEACGAEVVPVSMPDIFELSNWTLAYNAANRKEKLHTEFVKVLEENEVSAVIFPTYLSAPMRSGRDENGTVWGVWAQVFINNCARLSPSGSLPEISIPIGFHSRGSGIGMEIAAPRGSDQLLLDIAYSYTSRYDHRVLPEGAPDQYAASNSGSLREIIHRFHSFHQQAEARLTADRAFLIDRSAWGQALAELTASALTAAFMLT